LSLRLKECKLSAWRTAAGKLFHTTGPATEKALSPNFRPRTWNRVVGAGRRAEPIACRIIVDVGVYRIGTTFSPVHQPWEPECTASQTDGQTTRLRQQPIILCSSTIGYKRLSKISWFVIGMQRKLQHWAGYLHRNIMSASV